MKLSFDLQRLAWLLFLSPSWYDPRLWASSWAIINIELNPQSSLIDCLYDPQTPPIHAVPTVPVRWIGGSELSSDQRSLLS